MREAKNDQHTPAQWVRHIWRIVRCRRPWLRWTLVLPRPSLARSLQAARISSTLISKFNEQCNADARFRRRRSNSYASAQISASLLAIFVLRRRRQTPLRRQTDARDRLCEIYPSLIPLSRGWDDLHDLRNRVRRRRLMDNVTFYWTKN